jgi:hypothetical protein
VQTLLLLPYHLCELTSLLPSDENHSPHNGGRVVNIVAIATETAQPDEQDDDDDEEETG